MTGRMVVITNWRSCRGNEGDDAGLCEPGMMMGHSRWKCLDGSGRLEKRGQRPLERHIYGQR